MNLWVCIYDHGKGVLKNTLEMSIGNIISNRMPNQRVVYLRPFDIPFDAVAHKYLLDSLSKKSVLNWIDKHREETEVWLRVSDES